MKILCVLLFLFLTGCQTLQTLQEDTVALRAGYYSCLENQGHSSILIPTLYEWVQDQDCASEIQYQVSNALRVLRSHATLNGDLVQVYRYAGLIERVPESSVSQLRWLVAELYFGCQWALDETSLKDRQLQ